MSYDAIVLCGGTARRLNGADKAAVVVGGASLLDRALDSVSSATTVVAVGPVRATPIDVVWIQEDPPGGGPVDGIAAGLRLVEAATVVVLGVDFPFVDRACVARLLGAIGAHDGAILSDGEGHHQFLIGAYKSDALRRSLAGRASRDMSVTELVTDLELLSMQDPRATRDCDTWEDVALAQEMT